jgi:hypothetical protein
MTADEFGVRSVARGLQQSAPEAAVPGPEQHALNIFIGKWINEGSTVASADVPSVSIVTSDMYEWVPGGFVVLHSAYGRIGEFGGGGVELLSYDGDSGAYRSMFVDSLGNTVTSRLSVQDGVWTWQGERTRCTATFSDDGRTQTAHHERRTDQGEWEPSMEVELRKIC